MPADALFERVSSSQSTKVTGRLRRVHERVRNGLRGFSLAGGARDYNCDLIKWICFAIRLRNIIGPLVPRINTGIEVFKIARVGPHFEDTIRRKWRQD